MFFIGIFGIEDKRKDIRTLNDFPCKNCPGGSKGQLIKIFTCFHIFFIPIIRWNERYFIICENCNSVFTISKEKGIMLEENSDETVSFWDLKEEQESAIKRCPNCGAELNNNFEYCPYCGKKL